MVIRVCERVNIIYLDFMSLDILSGQDSRERLDGKRDSGVIKYFYFQMHNALILANRILPLMPASAAFLPHVHQAAEIKH